MTETYQHLEERCHKATNTLCKIKWLIDESGGSCFKCFDEIVETVKKYYEKEGE